MRARKLAKSLILCSLLLCGHLTYAEGQVTLVSHERVARVTLDGRVPVESVEPDPGDFSADVRDQRVERMCLPKVGCFDVVQAEGTAVQQSFVTLWDTGVLDVQGYGRVYQFRVGQSRSTLVTTFAVNGVQPYSLWFEGGQGNDVSATLSRADGTVVARQTGAPMQISSTGEIANGTYTLTVEGVAQGLFNDIRYYGEWDVRFAVGHAQTRGPYCTTSVDKRAYTQGDVVKARIAFGNYTGDPKAVELKIWVRLPNGHRIAAMNAGSDGTLILPGNYPAEYSFDLFGVGPDAVSGGYELGCSIVQPTTGEPLERSGYVFEIP